MKMKKMSVAAPLMAAGFLLGSLAAPVSARAQNFSVVYSFTGASDGGNPLNGLTANGNVLYGTASSGGTYNNGVVYKLADGVQTVVYNFTGGSDGSNPQGILIKGKGGMFGTTMYGGASNAGAVYEITSAGTEKTLYSFSGQADGANPQAGLTADAAGNLYGTTTAGGANGNGTVFKLIAPARGGVWTEQTLYSFGPSPDGAVPVGGLTFDAAGNLYGTTSSGGTYGFGTIFQLVSSQSGWTENILHEFENGDDGAVPYAGLVISKAGNLYGAATEGGVGGAGGTIFELTPSNGSWNFNVIFALPGSGISGTFRDIYLTAAGEIYGTTHCDGDYNAGTIYQLRLREGVWVYTVLYNFTGGDDGLYSFSNLVLQKGKLYGTTKYGGGYGNGVIFQISE